MEFKLEHPAHKAGAAQREAEFRNIANQATEMADMFQKAAAGEVVDLPQDLGVRCVKFADDMDAAIVMIETVIVKILSKP